jgi:SPP1 gp7 family putative phage head morphogenesis protein
MALRFNLAALVKRPSRKPIDLAPIRPTKTQADDLAALMMKALVPLDHAPAHIVAVYARELAALLHHDSVDQAGSAIDEMANAINRLVLQLTPSLKDWAFRAEAVHRGKWASTVNSRAGVDLSAMLGPQDAVESVDTFLQRVTSLIRDIGEEARGRIADSVFRGFQRRAPADEVAKEITDITGMARRRARRIASDQMVKLSSALDAQRQRQAGITEFKYRHGFKKHPRPWHAARDGKIYDADTLKQVGGGDVIAPDDAPGIPPFCSCVRQAHISFD